jgi:Holliday junction resolvase
VKRNGFFELKKMTNTSELSSDDLARLIHEALSLLGPKSGASEIASQVKRLDKGLPAEDEFSVICAWLGKCELVHKLDQHQLPSNSVESYQVPDFIARFKTQCDDKPVLIEVKSRTENKLSLKPEYLQRLKRYSNLMGMPLLFAWKFHSIWVLFEAKHFKLAKTNYNVSFQTAIRENLFGVLVGDFAYCIGKGAGVHFRLDKKGLVSTENSHEVETETWELEVADVTFSSSKGATITAPSSETQALFHISNLVDQSVVHSDFIQRSFTISEERLRFAHLSLVQLLETALKGDDKLVWRRIAKSKKFTMIDDFRGAIEKAMQEQIVTHIFNFKPHTVPDFLTPS